MRAEGAWRRLSRMSWDELRTRTRQEVTKRWDAARYRLGLPLATNGFAEPAEIPEKPPRFFFAPEEVPELIGLLRQRLPQQAEEMVRRAERICQHKFDLLGYSDLDYGREIDWHLDAVHGKRAPRKPWYRIRYLDFAEVGDAKVTWELNRHQHLVTLAKAYWLSGEERFAEEAFRQWYHWQQENPYPLGINWASSLEVAFRSLSWLWLRHLLSASPATPARFESDLLRALAQHGRHIECYLSTYFSPNTHLLGEGVGLFFIGTLCPQLKAAAHWQQLGWQTVLEEAERQVQPDGMHFEQSTYYHVYALDFLLHARSLAAANQQPIPPALDDKLLQMLDITVRLVDTGCLARLGDDDGGRVFDRGRNRGEHLLDPLATGAVLFRRADFKAAVGELPEETLWLLGAHGVQEFDQLPSVVPERKSACFAASGLHLMVSRDERAAQQLLIDAGSLGAGRAGHGHADALSIVLRLNGRDVLVDPGTCVYVASGRERDEFRATAAHNTLQVDGTSQAEPAGPFAWASLPEVRVEQWVAGETFDLFTGSHTGYRRLPAPVLHRRSVFYLKPRFWLVCDRAEGEGTHHLEIFWHLAPDFSHCRSLGNAVLARADDHAALAILPTEHSGWSEQLAQGFCSPVYGHKEPNLVLSFSRRQALPAEFATLLLPLDQPGQEVGWLTRLDSEAAGVSSYHYAAAGEQHFIWFSDRPGPWECAGWASDAQFVYYGFRPGRQHVILCQGSYLTVGGQRVLTLEQPAARWEQIQAGGETQIFCSHDLPGQRKFEFAPAALALLLPSGASDREESN